MEGQFHFRRPDGVFAPVIVDPMADADQAETAAQFIDRQAAERSELLAAGERVC